MINSWNMVDGTLMPCALNNKMHLFGIFVAFATENASLYQDCQN
jgi:hypothetical protein